MFSIMSSPSDSFTDSFSVWVMFASFSYLIAVAGTFNVILNKRYKIGQPCLIPDLRGNAFSFPLYSRMLVLGLSYMAFIMMRCVPSICTLWRVFIIKGYWIFPQTFSVSIELIIWFLFFSFFSLKGRVVLQYCDSFWHIARWYSFCICMLFFIRFYFTISYSKILNIVPCAISKSWLFFCFIYSSVCLFIPDS